MTARSRRTPLEVVARLRVPLGFLFGLASIWLSHPTLQTLAAGALLALAGETIRVWAAGHLEKGREITTSGPYAFTRHPLYVGSTLIGVGLAVASASLLVAAAVLSYLGITLTAAVRTEEAHLTEKFGAAYPEYRTGRTAGAARQFSLDRARRNREYRAVVGLLIVLVVLSWKAGIFGAS